LGSPEGEPNIPPSARMSVGFASANPTYVAGDNHEDQRPQPAQGHHRRSHQGQTTAHVRIDIGGGVIVTSSITNESVDSLGLKPGQAAPAVIKASDVMVAVD
jgi:molybdopterin-binding protein